MHTLALVEQLTFSDLATCAPRTADWRRLGLATPLILTEHEFLRTLDVFPLEYGDIIASHQVVVGEDPFAALRVSDTDLRRGHRATGQEPFDSSARGLPRNRQASPSQITATDRRVRRPVARRCCAPRPRARRRPNARDHRRPRPGNRRRGGHDHCGSVAAARALPRRGGTALAGSRREGMSTCRRMRASIAEGGAVPALSPASRASWPVCASDCPEALPTAGQRFRATSSRVGRAGARPPHSRAAAGDRRRGRRRDRADVQAVRGPSTSTRCGCSRTAAAASATRARTTAP